MSAGDNGRTFTSTTTTTIGLALSPRPVPGCRWADDIDGTCGHPATYTPECWHNSETDRSPCPLLDQPRPSRLVALVDPAALNAAATAVGAFRALAREVLPRIVDADVTHHGTLEAVPVDVGPSTTDEVGTPPMFDVVATMTRWTFTPMAAPAPEPGTPVPLAFDLGPV